MTMALQAFPQEVLTSPSLCVCLDEVSPGTFHLLRSGPVPRLPRRLSQDLLCPAARAPPASASPSPEPVSCSSVYSSSRPHPSVVSEKIIAKEIIWEDFARSEGYLYFP